MTRRCAIYARFSSDLQREASIEDQVRLCREYAARQGWFIVEEFVIADRAVSAASVVGRDGLQKLVKATKSKNRPFNCLLIDDTSRLARDLSDSIRTVKILEFCGVSVVSVSQGIDSSQGSARPLLAMHGIMDEQYLTDLAKKVHRGQEGRALHGFTTGGKVYGYNNVPIEDLSRMGKYGRPTVLGVKLAINAEQAAIIIRIFTMYSNGTGQGGIAALLNQEGVAGPNGSWSRYTIHEMLRNERYRGIFVWGRTKKDRNPETGKKVCRDTPVSQWRCVDVPDWRIVPEELWRAVEQRRKVASENFQRIGGRTRTDRSRRYLFSGLLVCGMCGGNMVIASGSGKRGYVKYGCHAHKHSGVCGNKLMIRQDRLEGQLLSAIEERILNPAVLNQVIARCEVEVRNRLAAMERDGSLATLESLKRDLDDKKRRQARIIAAIETAGDINTLTERLRNLENEITGIKVAIANFRPISFETAARGIREHVTTALLGFKESLATANDSDVTSAKAALERHVGKLVLTPLVRDGRPMYIVTGNFNVPEGNFEKCRMQVVARDGIEPPTPAFSGLRSLV